MMSGVCTIGNDNWLPPILAVVLFTIALYLGSFFFFFRCLMMWAGIARESGMLDSLETSSALSQMAFLIALADVPGIVKEHRLRFPRSNSRNKCALVAAVGIVMFYVATSLVSR